MALPAPLAALLTESLDAVQCDPYHHLRPFQRLRIYQALGDGIDISGQRFRQLHDHQPVAASHAQYAYGLLAIITARHALTLWNAAIPAMLRADETAETEIPAHLLHVGEQVLRNADGALAYGMRVLHDTHAWFIVLPYDQSYTSLFAAAAAYDALGATLGTAPFTTMDAIDRSLIDDDVY